MTKQSITVDFCVIGGGLAGVSAALAAARNGASVVLVQDRAVLGGNASSEIKMHVVGADCHGSRPGARETGLIEEFKLEDAYRNPDRTYSLWDLLLYEKVKENPNIRLLLESHCDGCETEETPAGKRITRAHVVRPQTEDEFWIEAKFFADCSGDGRLGAEAGADFRMGREARSEYDEPFALPVADSQTLGNSILFTAKRHDGPRPFVTPSWARPFRKEEFKLRPIKTFEYGYWWAEWGGQFDTIKDYESIRHELLRIAMGVWGYIKNSGEHPDAANWALEWVGAIPGKRESRRFLGDHVLVQQDIESGRIFDDQVAYGGWWLDLHPPSGMDAIDEEPCVQHHIKHLYSIPLRALYSHNIDNLFFAGRNISATHVAFASTRVMATCSVMGQGIGTAAAICSRKNPEKPLRELCDADTVRRIQQTLLRDDAFLPALHNEDPGDLARGAQCTADSESPVAPASAAVNGINRKILPEWGPWAENAENCWQSQALPARIELRLPEPAGVREIHLTFCSGLQRELTLTPSEYVNSKVVRGAQPEPANHSTWREPNGSRYCIPKLVQHLSNAQQFHHADVHDRRWRDYGELGLWHCDIRKHEQ
ncbi:MAG: FAD-dependent oxidoreductase [Verrucomicrobiaceae bacterium]|nr:MAG: FAD-dependent oxidoreductase [Verrucomicrobiaceae bacterium]